MDNEDAKALILHIQRTVSQNCPFDPLDRIDARYERALGAIETICRRVVIAVRNNQALSLDLWEK